LNFKSTKIFLKLQIFDKKAPQTCRSIYLSKIKCDLEYQNLRESIYWIYSISG